MANGKAPHLFVFEIGVPRVTPGFRLLRPVVPPLRRVLQNVPPQVVLLAAGLLSGLGRVISLRGSAALLRVRVVRGLGLHRRALSGLLLVLLLGRRLL